MGDLGSRVTRTCALAVCFVLAVGCALLLVLGGCHVIFPLESVAGDGPSVNRDRGPRDGSRDGLGVETGTHDIGTRDVGSADVTPLDAFVPCIPTACPLGCNESLNRCYRLSPSNISAVTKGTFAMALDDLVADAASSTIDVDMGGIWVGGVVVRPAGSKGAAANGIYWNTIPQGAGYPEISVFVVKSLTLDASCELSVVGTRALAIFATETVSISGTVSLIPGGSTPGVGPVAGAGGFAGGAKGQAGASCFGGEGGAGEAGLTQPQQCGGGGGGAGTGVGGKGGIGASGTFAGGAGGAAITESTLVPLGGGCGGGGGGFSAGGGGGGAIQISANESIFVAASGIITAPGAGGLPNGGGGGGGAILLEAPSLFVAGLLAANGGGGGGFTSLTGATGSVGPASQARAAGGGITGGAGGAASPASGAAGLSWSDPHAPGGGGGGAGRIRWNSPSAHVVSARFSPAPTSGTDLVKY